MNILLIIWLLCIRLFLSKLNNKRSPNVELVRASRTGEEIVIVKVMRQEENVISNIVQ